MLSRVQLLKFAVGGLVVLSSLGTPARADDLVQNLGPVGPHQPILATVGNKRVIAFYMPGSDRCSLHAVVWDTTGPDAGSLAARVRISLEPGQYRPHLTPPKTGHSRPSILGAVTMLKSLQFSTWIARLPPTPRSSQKDNP